MAQHIKSVLKNAHELGSLLVKAQSLSALLNHFASVAPPHLAHSAQVLGLQLGTLSIAVPNAANAAKLRQLAPELVTQLQNRGCEVSGIRVKVQVSFDRRQPKSTPRTLSKKSLDALNELSLNLANSPLKMALERMSRKTE